MCAGFFSLVACKEASVIKPDLIPPVDNINTFRLSAADFDIQIQNGYFDSLRTDDATYPIAPIGSIDNDPFFGTTDAGIYFQVAPNVDKFSFPDDMTGIDSAVLVLPFTGVSYGDTTHTSYQALKVYRITQADFKIDVNTQKYYAFSSVSADMANPIGAGRVSAKAIKYDSTAYPAGGDTVGSQLRLRLTDAFANEIKGLSDDVFANFSSFIDYFKGVYVAPDPSAAAEDRKRISYFYLGVSSSDVYRKARIEFWYHVTGSTTGKVAMFTYNPISSAFFAGIKRNRTGTPAEALYSSIGAARDSIVIQGAPGFYTDLTIKNIQDIPASIINKAEIRITALKLGNDDILTTPLQLIPSGVDANGALYTIADLLDVSGSQTSGTQAFVGGTPKEVEIDGAKYIQYTINIPRELQQAKTAGKTELKIRLSSSTNLPGAYRMVAPGPGAPGALQMKFDVIYSKMN